MGVGQRRCYPSGSKPIEVYSRRFLSRQGSPFGTIPTRCDELNQPDRVTRALADWLVERDVDEVVMESTAQYWRPVWEALERYWRPRRRAHERATPMSGTLHLAQAQSNRGPGGRKKDFPDAERLVKRLVAQELTLSFVPDVEQRLWRTVMRRKYQITRNRVQLHNRLEALLEEAHIKVSSLVSDLLGVSARLYSAKTSIRPKAPDCWTAG